MLPVVVMARRQTSRMESFSAAAWRKNFSWFFRGKEREKNYDEVSIVALTSNFIAYNLLLKIFHFLNSQLLPHARSFSCDFV
jgi:hypothetical protein